MTNDNSGKLHVKVGIAMFENISYSILRSETKSQNLIFLQ